MKGDRHVLEMALATAEVLGPVFPLAPKSKEPFGLLVPNGVHGATRDLAIIRSWFRPCSSLNLALALGAGLLLLDVDPRSGGDDTIDDLQREHGDLPHTVRAITGRRDGGMHYFYRYPSEVRFKNGAIAAGVDVKGDGGYAAIAPSIHPDTGHEYIWDPRALPSRTPIGEAPAWLLEMLKSREVRDYGDATGKTAESFIGIAFGAMGWLGPERGDRARCVRCPWSDTHTDGRGLGDDSSTVILAPTDKAKLGSFVCTHSHCAGKRTGNALRACTAEALGKAAAVLPRLANDAARWLADEECAA